MNEKEKLQPKVRFREFIGENAPDWEQRKLGEVANMHARIGWQNLRTSEFLDSGEYMLITGTDFQDGKIDYSKVHYVEKERYEQDKKIQISNGSILITKDGTIGKVAYVENLPMKSTLNAGVFNLTVVDDINTSSLYLYHYLKGPFLLRFVNEESTGGTIKHLNQNVLVKFPIPLPIYREQLKVSSFLTNIDKLITLHQRKLEQLEQLKNTLLSKMFPKSGTNIPEIRFSGFTDAWKQRKAKEIFITISEKGHIDLPVLSASQEFGMVERNNIGIDIKYDLNSIKNYKRVLPKQFVIHLRSFQGGFAWSTIEGITSPAYTVIDFIEKSNQDFGFWKIFLTSTNFIKKLETVTYGIRDGRSISFNDFSSMNFVIPNINEQERIGNLFQKIDNYIAIHQRKLEQLKNLKQTLLNKMFI